MKKKKNSVSTNCGSRVSKKGLDKVENSNNNTGHLLKYTINIDNKSYDDSTEANINNGLQSKPITLTYVSNLVCTGNSTTVITSHVLYNRMKLATSASKFISSQFIFKIRTFRLDKTELSNHLNILNIAIFKSNISIYNTSPIKNDTSAHQTSTKSKIFTIINNLSSSHITFTNPISFSVRTNLIISSTISLIVKDFQILKAKYQLFSLFPQKM